MATLNASTFTSRADAERHYLSLIDEAAAKGRAIDTAQAEVYREKFEEARAGGGALLIAEAEVTGTSVKKLCQAVLKQHESQRQLVNSIELMRVKAKAEVRGAANAAAMHRIYHEFKEAL